jgi:hypothetical protein
MELEIGLSVAIGVWIALVLLVISLCRAAKRSDEAMERAMADALAAGRGAKITEPPRSEQPLRSLGLDDAATLLGVSPDTLLAWQARYGFPTSSRAEPHYNQAEVLALRDSLQDGLSIAGAVSRARQQIRRRRGSIAQRLTGDRGGGLAS